MDTAKYLEELVHVAAVAVAAIESACKTDEALGLLELSDVLELVKLERGRQRTLWGEQRHPPEWWVAILGEEYGEVCRAVLEMSFSEKELDGKTKIVYNSDGQSRSQGG